MDLNKKALKTVGVVNLRKEIKILNETELMENSISLKTPKNDLIDIFLDSIDDICEDGKKDKIPETCVKLYNDIIMIIQPPEEEVIEETIVEKPKEETIVEKPKEETIVEKPKTKKTKKEEVKKVKTKLRKKKDKEDNKKEDNKKEDNKTIVTENKEDKKENDIIVKEKIKSPEKVNKKIVDDKKVDDKKVDDKKVDDKKVKKSKETTLSGRVINKKYGQMDLLLYEGSTLDALIDMLISNFGMDKKKARTTAKGHIKSCKNRMENIQENNGVFTLIV